MSEVLNTVFGQHEPFVWQRELHRCIHANAPPAYIDMPTAAGKTFGFLRCWLAALVEHPSLVPRRLVYAVNRRAVIDQVYEDALKLADVGAEPPLRTELTAAIPGTDPERPLSV